MAKKDESVVEPAEPTVSVPVSVLDVLLSQALDLTKYTDGDVKRVAVRVRETLLSLRGNG